MLGYTQPGGSVYSYFRNCVVTAGAKTGTAQLGGGQTNNGVFVCFAPYDDPEIALAMVIEHGGSGAALASTAVKILNAYFYRGRDRHRRHRRKPAAAVRLEPSARPS